MDLKVGGAHVAAGAFIRAFTEGALYDYKQRIMTLSGMDPQVGLGLLRLSVELVPTFLRQVGFVTSRGRTLSHRLFAG